MRTLRIAINGKMLNADLDDDSAVGIDFQQFDVKEPIYRKFNITNNFSIPRTNNNNYIFGLTDGQQMFINPNKLEKVIKTNTNSVYARNTCEYRIDDIITIEGTIRVTKVDKNRIHLFIKQNTDFFDILDSISWSEFEDIYLQWAIETKGEYGEYYTTSKVNISGITSTKLTEDSYYNVRKLVVVKDDFDELFPEFIRRYGPDIDFMNSSSTFIFIPQHTEEDVDLNQSGKIYDYYPEMKTENTGRPLFVQTLNNSGNLGHFGCKFGTKFTRILEFISYYMNVYYPKNVESDGMDALYRFTYNNSNKKLINTGVIIPSIYVNMVKNFGTSASFFLSTQHYAKMDGSTMEFRANNSQLCCDGLSLLDYVKSVVQMLGLSITINKGIDNIINVELNKIIDNDVKIYTFINDGVLFNQMVSQDATTIVDDNWTDDIEYVPFVDGYFWKNFVGPEKGFEDSIFIVDGKTIQTSYWRKNVFFSYNYNLRDYTKEPYNATYPTDYQYGIEEYNKLNHVFKIKGWQPSTYEQYPSSLVLRCSSLAFWNYNRVSSFNHFLFGTHVLLNDGKNYGYKPPVIGDYETVMAAINWRPTGVNVESRYCDMICYKVTSFMHYNSNTYYGGTADGVTNSLFVDGAMTSIGRMVNAPAVYTCKKYINPNELGQTFRMNKPVYVKMLGGWFHINKISRFNPDKSDEPVTIELVKIETDN